MTQGLQEGKVSVEEVPLQELLERQKQLRGIDNPYHGLHSSGSLPLVAVLTAAGNRSCRDPDLP